MFVIYQIPELNVSYLLFPIWLVVKLIDRILSANMTKVGIEYLASFSDSSILSIKLAKKLGPGCTIVTILCDYGSRYASKIFNPSFLKERGLPVPDWI